MFRRGRRTSFKYQPLDYNGGYTLDAATAYGQLNQILDLAATDPKHHKGYMKAADRWIYIISNLEQEAEAPHEPIGFRVNPKETE